MVGNRVPGLWIGKPVAYLIVAIRHQIRRSQITLKIEMWTNPQRMIDATSAEVTPDGGLIGIFSQNTLDLGIIVNCPDSTKKNTGDIITDIKML